MLQTDLIIRSYTSRTLTKRGCFDIKCDIEKTDKEQSCDKPRLPLVQSAYIKIVNYNHGKYTISVFNQM